MPDDQALLDKLITDPHFAMKIVGAEDPLLTIKEAGFSVSDEFKPRVEETVRKLRIMWSDQWRLLLAPAPAPDNPNSRAGNW